MPQPLPNFDINSPGRAFLSVITVITSVLVLLSPAPTVYKVIKNGSVGELSVVPYLSLFVSSLAWMLYGAVIKEMIVMATNLIGCVLTVGYTAVYHNISLGGRSRDDVPSPLMFGITKGQSPEVFRRRLIEYYFITAIVTIVLILLTTLFKDQSQRIKASSIAALVLYLSFLVSPFVTIVKVLRTKSVESLPFDLSFMLLINGIIWIIYEDLITNSLTLKISNFAGVISASLQLLCHFIYGKPFWSLIRMFCCGFIFDDTFAFYEDKLSESAIEHTSVEVISQTNDNKVNGTHITGPDIEDQKHSHIDNGTIETDKNMNDKYNSIAIN